MDSKYSLENKKIIMFKSGYLYLLNRHKFNKMVVRFNKSRFYVFWWILWNLNYFFWKKYLNAKESAIQDIGPNDKISKQLDLLTEKEGCKDDSALSLDKAPNFW